MFSLDDAEADQMAIRRAMATVAPDVELRTFRRVDEMFGALAELGGHALPNLVLLDLNLNGDDGNEVLRRMRSDHPTVPVAMLSGSARPDELTRAYELGANGFLVKPLGIRALADLIEPAVRYWCGAVTRP